MNPKKFLENFGRPETLWMYACARCGECVDVCPVYKETDDKYTAPGYKIKKMRGLIHKQLMPFGGGADKETVEKVAKGLYECTLCGRCWSVCPYNYDLVDLWEKARESAFDNGLAIDGHLQMIDALKAENNIFKMAHDRRRKWATGLDVPVGEKADVVFFVGCLMSYRGQLKPSAKAMATIMNAAGEKWTLLENEVCCGVPMKFSGGVESMKELIDTNVSEIESTGAKKIVFSCPGCYRMFKQEYSKLLGDRVQLVHSTELIDSYLKAGKIKLNKSDQTITYHDPCELSRLIGVIEEPRNVFAKLTNSYVELPGNKFNVECCGGGGLYKAADIDRSLEIAKKRIGQAENKRAATLTTACPSCYMTLSQAARQKKSEVKVSDFAEVVAQLLE
ncbi:MAG: (Fe-S)-binding protein [Candidatus Bathyarchaeota archaeon]|jgi:heterodisulfide reductase subunit D|nr:(Fe-S)-binding protein [Candidatus Bathyarchaeota archaeon]